MNSECPTVFVIARHHLYAVSLLRELKEDFDIRVVCLIDDGVAPVMRSRNCDETIRISAKDVEEYQEKVISQLHLSEPAVVLPVGAFSVRLLDSIRNKIPESVSVPLPSRSSIKIALDKRRTANIAKELKIPTPREYGVYEGDFRDINSGSIEYPVFIKSASEAGQNYLETAQSERELRSKCKVLHRECGRDPILVQEYVNQDSPTYGCGVYVRSGEVEMSFCHEEVRSIPRLGGTGTHVKSFESEKLESQTEKLVKRLDWEGIALAEYKQRQDGEYVLMEINPKFWASYALAAHCNYRFASAIVSDALPNVDKKVENIHNHNTIEMIFPLRELYFLLSNRDQESALDVIQTIFKEGTIWDINQKDPLPWIFPIGLTQAAYLIQYFWLGGENPFEDRLSFPHENEELA
jgi:predicted ATP-grasp superfamily ATP-dependent carboligase